MFKPLSSLLLFALICICAYQQNKSSGGGNIENQGMECAVEGSCHQEVIPKGANVHGSPIAAPIECVDRYDACRDFAAADECNKNPGWMTVNCPSSCNHCHLRDPNVRCSRSFLNISSDPIYIPGDMSKMFSRIEEEFKNRYKVTILSKSPWAVILDNFITDSEIKSILESVDNWERSTDTGSQNEYGEAGKYCPKVELAQTLGVVKDVNPIQMFKTSYQK